MAIAYHNDIETEMRDGQGQAGSDVSAGVNRRADGGEPAPRTEDAGISGAKGRDSRPGFNAMLNDATRRRFDILLFWSIDRLGRSTAMVATALAELEAAGVAIYADKEAVDATTPHGRAMLQMAAVFGELERAMIRERVMAGLARAKAESPEQRRRNGKKAIGRPKISAKIEEAIREQLRDGIGIVRVAKLVGAGVGTVQRIKRAIELPSRS